MRGSLAVAVAQPACADLDVALNVARHAEVVRRAGARLVVFPQLSLTGYDLAAPAVALDDPRLEPLRSACADAGATALVGAPVREDDGRESIAMLAVTGEHTAVVYRKMHVYGEELHRFAPGEKPEILELEGWRLGLAICRDAAMAHHAADTAALGMDAYVVTALYGPGPQQAARRDGHMSERTAAHGVWGVLSSIAGPSGHYRETSGGSGIWAPDGRIHAQAGQEPGDVVTATLH